MTTRRMLPTRRLLSSRRIRYRAPALEKGLDILELLASVSEALTHSEIASRHAVANPAISAEAYGRVLLGITEPVIPL